MEQPLLRLESTGPASVDKYLMPDEQQVIIIRQNPFRMVPSLALAVGGLLAAIAVDPIPTGSTSTHLIVWTLALLLILRFIWEASNWVVQFLVFTSRRLVVISGILSRKIISIPLEKFSDMDYHRSAGGRMFGYGTFSVELGGKTKTVIDYVPYPEQIFLEVQGVIQANNERSVDSEETD